MDSSSEDVLQRPVEFDFSSFLGASYDEFNFKSASSAVKGRLSASIDFWKSTLCAPEFVLDTVRRGYRLPFAEYSPSCFLANNRSAFQNPDFVTQAISELLANGCIIEHSVPPFCVNPLSVAKGKKLRLVIDLRHVNSFLVRFKFKYEDLRSLSQVLEEEHWFFTWDLKSGYHHVDICLEHQMYLGFSWQFNGMLIYFTFRVLPFGLSTACFCVTKLLRPLVSRWRSMGHNSFTYLDDRLGSQPDKCSAAAAAMIQKKELDSAGLLVNEEKSHWHPLQVGEWLGLVINTITMSFHIPERKVKKLKSLLRSAIGETSYSYRELTRIAGSIISVALAVGPISRLLTRQMYLAIESRSAWDHTLRFSRALLEELRFWYNNIDSFNSYSLRPPPDSSTVVFADASDVAFGGFSASLDGVMASGTFTSEDLGQSSTYRELKAIYYDLYCCPARSSCGRRE